MNHHQQDSHGVDVAQAERSSILNALEIERRRVDELERVNDELRRRDRLKDEFLSNVAHELRTSLASVKNVVSNALAGVTGELPLKLRKSLLLADENLKRFSHIINDLLDAARLESGKIILHRSMVDPVQVIAATVASFETEAVGKDLKLRSNWNVPPMFVFMDPTRITQVVGNLIGNALKFTPSGGSISVSGYVVNEAKKILSDKAMKKLPKGLSLAVEVADTGPGIDPRKIEKVFDRYEQAHSRNSGGESGLGLGLSICKQLVGLHGGEIWVENEKEGGAKFVFTVPFLAREAMFREALTDQLQMAAIHEDPITIVIFDFKIIEPNNLSPKARRIGEDIALEIEAVMQKTLRRRGDMAMWRGGAKFGIILPQTASEQSGFVADRIRAAISSEHLKQGKTTVRLSATSAIAGFGEDADSADILIAAAEERLKTSLTV